VGEEAGGKCLPSGFIGKVEVDGQVEARQQRRVQVALPVGGGNEGAAGAPLEALNLYRLGALHVRPGSHSRRAEDVKVG
jgi:hypothetical protein